MSWLKLALPLGLGIAALVAWELAVAHYQVPVFVLPPPSAIWPSFVENFSSLMDALWVTLRVTWMAFGFALLYL